MRILVLGAGAIGGYYGMQLAEGGADVSFLVRPARAAQLAAEGLVLHSRGETRQRAVPTLLAPQGAFDIILLTCKAYDLASAMAATEPAMGSASLVLPLLNGLAHMDALDERFGAARVLGGVAHIATTLEADGAIRHSSPNDNITFGDRSGAITAPVAALAQAFAQTPVAARASDAILQAMWEKWAMLAAGAGITCLLRGTIGEVLATDDGAAIAARFVAETRAIASAHGHPPGPAAIAAADALLGNPASGWAASMMRDIQAARPRLEAWHILGDLIRRGREKGIAAPMLEAAHSQLQAYNTRAGAAA